MLRITKDNIELAKEANRKELTKELRLRLKCKKEYSYKKMAPYLYKSSTLCTQRCGPEFFSTTCVHVSITKNGLGQSCFEHKNCITYLNMVRNLKKKIKKKWGCILKCYDSGGYSATTEARHISPSTGIFEINF